MAQYRLTAFEGVVQRFDPPPLTTIPNDPKNADWIRYQAWLDAGGVPDPYKQPSPSFDAPAIVEQSYRAGLERQADKLQAKGKTYDAIKLLFKATG
jgi:hypothetical protein